MAKVLLGANMVAISGKLGGTVYQTGKGGTIMRRKVSPRKHTRSNFFTNALGLQDPESMRKQTMSFVSSMWNELTEAERQTWFREKVRGKEGKETYMLYNSLTYLGIGLQRTFPRQLPALPVITRAEAVQSPTVHYVYHTIINIRNPQPGLFLFLYVSGPMLQSRKAPINGWRMIYFTSTVSGSNLHDFNAGTFNLPLNYYYQFAYRIGYDGVIADKHFIPMERTLH